MRKKFGVILLAAFLVIMVVFTIVSRVMDEKRIPVVSVCGYSSSTLEYLIMGTGTVAVRESEFVDIEPGLRIVEKYKNQGDRISEGEALFRYHLADIEERLELLEVEAYQSGIPSADYYRHQKGIFDSLIASEGIVYAPSEGYIVNEELTVGRRTDGRECFTIGNSDYTINGYLMKEDNAEMLSVGDYMTVSITGNGEKDASITEYGRDETGNYEVSLNLDGTEYAYGADAMFYENIRSQKYDCCVPVSALRTDENGRSYILLLQVRQSVLGSREIAVKKTVTVLGTDSRNAAIEADLSKDDMIIYASEAEINAGDRVKTEE